MFARFATSGVCQGFPEQYHPFAAIAFRHVLNIRPMYLGVGLEMPAHLLPECLGPVIQRGKSGARPILIIVFFHLHFSQKSCALTVTLKQNFYSKMKNIFII
jgi:hypothetical protein